MTPLVFFFLFFTVSSQLEPFGSRFIDVKIKEFELVNSQAYHAKVTRDM